MAKGKTTKIIFFFLMTAIGIVFSSVTAENVRTYEELYTLQRDPDRLQYAVDCALSTLMHAKETFTSEEEASRLLERIYTKVDLLKKYTVQDPVFTAIVRESTPELLNALKKVKSESEDYKDAYELMDFVYVDFSKLIAKYNFKGFQEFFQTNKLQGFSIVENISGEELKILTEKIIETIKKSNYFLDADTYTQLIGFGGEKFLNYLNIQINPYLQLSDENTYDQQYALLKTFVNLFESYYPDTYLQKIPQDKLNYFLNLESYINYIGDVEILSRRLLTAQSETLNTLFPVFVKYIKEYDKISIKTDKLKNSVHNLIKNASTRLSYDKVEIDAQALKLSDLSIGNDELNNSLNTLVFMIQKNRVTPEVLSESNPEKLKFMPPYQFLIILSVLLFVTLILTVFLPLKFRALIAKSFGLKSLSLSMLEKAAIKKPMDPDIHIRIAQLYEKMGREEEAINEYKIASKVMDMKEE